MHILTIAIVLLFLVIPILSIIGIHIWLWLRKCDREDSGYKHTNACTCRRSKLEKFLRRFKK